MNARMNPSKESAAAASGASARTLREKTAIRLRPLTLAAALLAPPASAAPPAPRTPDAILTARDDGTLRYGEAVAADGRLLAVGSPAAGDTWDAPCSVDLFEIVPAFPSPPHDGAPARPGFRATLLATLRSNRVGDHFGTSLAVRAAPDGQSTLIAVGADMAHAELPDGSGVIDFAGAVELFGSSGRGPSAAHLATLAAEAPEAAAEFGCALAIGPDGGLLAIGSRRRDHASDLDAGAVHVFVTEERGATGVSWLEREMIVAPRPSTSAWFGSAVAIGSVGDAVVLAIGAPGEDTSPELRSAGAVHLYARAPTDRTFSFLATIRSPAPSRFAWFGSSLAIDGTRLVVGEPRGIAAGGSAPTQAGAVWVFDLETVDPPRLLAPPFVEPGLGFGQSVAIRGGTVLVGAPGADRANARGAIEDAGVAMLFDLERPVHAHPGEGDGTPVLLADRAPRPMGLLATTTALIVPRVDGESTRPTAYAAVGHLYVEEESTAPSQGVAIFAVPLSGSFPSAPAAPPLRASTTSRASVASPRRRCTR